MLQYVDQIHEILKLEPDILPRHIKAQLSLALVRKHRYDDIYLRVDGFYTVVHHTAELPESNFVNLLCRRTARTGLATLQAYQHRTKHPSSSCSQAAKRHPTS